MPKYDRQLATVLNLQVPPQPRYELRSYSVNRIKRLGGGSYLPTLSVTRTYAEPGWKIAIHECIFVGPRGGTKTIYNNIY